MKLARVLEMEHGDLVNEIQESRAKIMFSLSEKWEDDDGAVEKVEILEDKTATDPVHDLESFHRVDPGRGWTQDDVTPTWGLRHVLGNLAQVGEG